MEIKKSKEADLERDRLDLVLFGLIISFSLIYIAFEWTKGKTEEKVEDFQTVQTVPEEQIDEIPQTTQDELPPPPPPAPEVPVEIELNVTENAKTTTVEVNTEDDHKAIEPVAAPPVQNVPAAPVEVIDQQIYTHVDKKAVFPGGDKALLAYLGTHIHYPEAARENGSQGTSFIKFTVNIDGSIQDVEVVRSAGDASLDNEAMKVIKGMPKWSAGENNGKKVRSKFQVPVRFKLGA